MCWSCGMGLIDFWGLARWLFVCASVFLGLLLWETGERSPLVSRVAVCLAGCKSRGGEERSISASRKASAVTSRRGFGVSVSTPSARWLFFLRFRPAGRSEREIEREKRLACSSSSADDVCLTVYGGARARRVNLRGLVDAPAFKRCCCYCRVYDCY